MKTHGGSMESTDDRGDPSAAAELSIESQRVRLRAAVHVPAHDAPRLLRVALVIVETLAGLGCFALAAHVASRGPSQPVWVDWAVVAAICGAGLWLVACAAVLALRRGHRGPSLSDNEYGASQNPSMPHDQMIYDRGRIRRNPAPSEQDPTGTGDPSPASRPTHP